MILVNSALDEIGNKGLLLSLKANEFYNGESLVKEDYQKLFSFLSNPNEPLTFTEAMKDNILLIAFYFEMENIKEMQEAYTRKYLNVSLASILKPGSQIEQLHFWFNLIELDYKYHHRPIEELKQIGDELNEFSEAKLVFEDSLLLKYYSGVVSFLINNIAKSKEYTMEIILDISEKGVNDNEKTTLLKYIELKNSILAIKSIEKENPVKNRQEMLNNLECLFEIAKTQNEDFALMLGIKMNSIQAANMNYSACSKIFDELLNILHKKILFGKTNSNLLEQYLYVSAQYGYYQTLLGNSDQVMRSIKKISKSLSLLEEIKQKDNSFDSIVNGSSIISQTLLSQYSFFNLVLKQNEKISMDKTEQNKVITNYKTFLGMSIKERNEVLLNIYSLNNFDSTAQQYMEKRSLYQQSFINKDFLSDSQLLLAYLYLYNSISSLTKSMVSDNNTSKQAEYMKKIKAYAQLVIDYTINGISNNDNLKSLFQLNYFKEIFNKIYFTNIYSYYHEKKYNEVVSKVDDFLNCIKFQFELGSGKNIYNIIQLKGDALMKMHNYKGALDVYNSIIDHCHNKALVNFKLGACNMMVNNVTKGKQYLQYSHQLYDNDNDKKRAIDAMIKKINI